MCSLAAGRKENSISIGKAIGGKLPLYLPLKTMVMHGLIGGSTGTGKSRIIQLLSEQLNSIGVPVLLADLKGDMTGFIQPNDSRNCASRAKELGISYTPSSFQTNFFSISNRFIPFRLVLNDIDPLLIARILNLNQVQESNLRMAFLYAKDKGIVVRDFVDLQTIFVYLSNHPGHVSGMSKSTIDVILRQISLAIGEGLNDLFGEPSFDISDLFSGKISVLNLSDWRKRSDLPAILMAFILYRLFHELDDVGSVDQPRIVLFIDEAHYLFTNSNPALVSLFTNILKQIRSKGVAVFFSTQNPEDLPEKILEQLGCKIQFALRAFSKEELDDINGLAKSFPPAKFDVAKEILSLEIGEAVVSPLSDVGKPLPPIKASIYPPRSSLKVIDDRSVVKNIDSTLLAKYSNSIPLERYDLLEPLEGLRKRKANSCEIKMREQAKIARAEARVTGRRWSALKTIALFFLFVFLLLIILILLLMNTGILN